MTSEWTRFGTDTITTHGHPAFDAQELRGGHSSCDPAPLTTSFGTVGQWERQHRATCLSTRSTQPAFATTARLVTSPASSILHQRSALSAQMCKEIVIVTGARVKDSARRGIADSSHTSIGTAVSDPVRFRSPLLKEVVPSLSLLLVSSRTVRPEFRWRLPCPIHRNHGWIHVSADSFVCSTRLHSIAASGSQHENSTQRGDQCAHAWKNSRSEAITSRTRGRLPSHRRRPRAENKYWVLLMEVSMEVTLKSRRVTNSSPRLYPRAHLPSRLRRSHLLIFLRKSKPKVLAQSLRLPWRCWCGHQRSSVSSLEDRD